MPGPARRVAPAPGRIAVETPEAPLEFHPGPADQGCIGKGVPERAPVAGREDAPIQQEHGAPVRAGPDQAAEALLEAERRQRHLVVT
jgi:hypothetical protein